MDEQASSENPSKDFNKLDLTQLQGFSFGTQWTQDKTSRPHGNDARRSGQDGGRPQRHAGGGGDPRRDRRTFRKLPSAPGDAPAPAAGEQPRRDDRPFRRDTREGGRPGAHDQQGGPRRDDRRDFRGPRRDDRRPGPGHAGDFRGPRRDAAHAPAERPGPYFSPFYEVMFYAEDSGFNALVKAIRSSCRTYELFELARIVLGKNDRFVASIQRIQPGSAQARDPRFRQPRQQPAGAEAAPAPAPVKLPPLAISIPDGLPFDNEEAAIAHVLGKHLDRFFDSAEVEVDPPKGNYQIVNKCGVTGELLAPPNYHLYNQIVQQHHASRLPNMGVDAFRSRIESVRDPEVVKQWLEKMRKTTRYTWKLTPPAEGAQPLAFDSFDEARAYLLSSARDKVVSTAMTVRMHGKLLENLPQGEIRRAIESTLERQRRFPLDTANALRGRFRRESFTIFKKGSKGVSYVCAVKRKFRVPGQTFADSIDALITFIEANPLVKASELPAKFLGIQQSEPAAAPVSETPRAPVEPASAAESAASSETAPADAAVESAPAVEATAPAPESSAQAEPAIAPATSGSVAPFAVSAAPLSAEDQSRMHRLTGDLRWLVTEGYVTEYIDGALFTYPPMSEARKKEVETEDSEDIPAPSATAQSAAGQPAAEQPVDELPVEASSEPGQPAPAIEPEATPPAAEIETPEAQPEEPKS